VTGRLLLVLLVLTSCGSTDNSPQAQCERQVNNDPKVTEIYTRSNGIYTQQKLNELAVLKRQAALQCLRLKGLAPPGGVEPVQERN
jgi:hypothetical protein